MRATDQLIANHFSIQETGRLLGIKEASKFLGLPVWTIRTLIWNRELPIVRIGERRQYLDVKDLESYVENNKAYHE